MNKPNKLEVLFWSIALPGFGQFLNKKLIKGIIFIALEFIINVKSNFNIMIKESFLGNIEQAIYAANFQWIMFYPCVYMFGIWDAYRDASEEVSAYAFLPFAFGAFTITIGLIFSTNIKIFGVLLGPVWLPMVSLVPGVIIGILLKKILEK